MYSLPFGPRPIFQMLMSVFVCDCLASLDAAAQVLSGNSALPPVSEIMTIETLPTNDAASMAISPDGTQLAVVALEAGRNTYASDAESAAAGEPVRLFTVPMKFGSQITSLAQQYMVDRYGEKFLVLEATPEQSPVHVLGTGIP